MSHRISMTDAKEKRDWELHTQELAKAGLPTDKLTRVQKKQIRRESKVRRFTNMLLKREGHFTQSEEYQKMLKQKEAEEKEKNDKK